jgi:glycosyl transferase family 25
MADLQITTFIINLRRRLDRKRRMGAALPTCLRSGSEICWTEAIDGRHVDAHDLRGFALFPSWNIESSNPWWSRPLKSGEVG